MAENTGEPKPGFYRLVWMQACADWRSTRDKVPWSVVTALLAVVVALFVGVKQMIPLWATIGIPLVAAFLFFLGYLFRAPAKVWAADQKFITGLTAVCERLESNAAQQATQLAELNEGISSLNRVNADLRTRLDAKRQLVLVPRMGEEDHPIGILPTTFGDIEGPEEDLLDRTVITGRISEILIVNNDDHPTTILRLWLRVSDPVTGAEIAPLPLRELGTPGNFMPPVEIFMPGDGTIEARGRRVFELEFTAHYPGDFGRRIGTREERAQMVTLCAEAVGLDSVCCSLPVEFFQSRPVPGDPRPPTASGQAPPSSPESSG
jgi:hypothetical protein